MESSPILIPDGIEPIVGYWEWQYSLGVRHAHLHSMNSSAADLLNGRTDWEGAGSRWIVVSCGFGWEHTAPDEACTCGLYSVKRLDQLLNSPTLPLRGVPMRYVRERICVGETEVACGAVLGRVELAGKIIEHAYGYRAERARVAELIPLLGSEQVIIRLAARLGVGMGSSVQPSKRAKARLAAALGLPEDFVLQPPPDPPDPKDPSSPRRRIADWVRSAA